MSFSAAIYFDQNFFSQTSGITEATCQLQSSLGQIWSPRKFFQLLFLDTDFADVTLACDDGQVVHAHRVVLAFFSPFFKAILSKSSHPSTLVHMQGVNIEQIKQVLKFIYLGSVQIENDQLESFYETRSRLKIDETDTLSFEVPTSENNAKGEQVALSNRETIKIRESVNVSRSERLDDDTKKRHEKDDLTCGTSLEKHFTCNACLKGFTQKGVLVRHKKFYCHKAATIDHLEASKRRNEMEAFYETRSSLKIDVTDTLSFERSTSENNAKGDVALRNAETIKIK